MKVSVENIKPGMQIIPGCEVKKIVRKDPTLAQSERFWIFVDMPALKQYKIIVKNVGEKIEIS